MPFAVAAATLLVVSVAIFRLPGAFVADMKQDGFLTGDSADVAFVFIAAMALAQAAYAGFAILRPARLEQWPEPGDSVVIAARNAAGIASLTLVYGVTAFLLTGLRAGFWYFVVLELAQGAWYYRQVGEIDRRLTEIRGAAVR
ncbi:MAG: hypothetical protein ACRDJV_00290 [Actinomycetota bacterium]